MLEGEIDQDVAADDQIELLATDRIEQALTLETDHAPEAGRRSCGAVGTDVELARGLRGGRVEERARHEHGAASLHQGRFVEIGARDAHHDAGSPVAGRESGPAVEGRREQGGQRVRLLAGGTAGAPDRDAMAPRF